ncbi:hypothetical protein [Streptosporangium sp. KLBMP 9127]|nr:hypothetical protein [Streptosporangium sp. KLBMP 9127]
MGGDTAPLVQWVDAAFDDVTTSLEERNEARRPSTVAGVIGLMVDAFGDGRGDPTPT